MPIQHQYQGIPKRAEEAEHHPMLIADGRTLVEFVDGLTAAHGVRIYDTNMQLVVTFPDWPALCEALRRG